MTVFREGFEKAKLKQSIKSLSIAREHDNVLILRNIEKDEWSVSI